jgi:hypothetical protein
VAEDLPPDVRAVLTQLFAEGQDALAADDRDTAVETVTTAETVAANKLSEGAFRDRLLHGCERVRRLLGDDTDRQGDPREVGGAPEMEAPDDPAVAAAAYLSAMERRVASANESA